MEYALIKSLVQRKDSAFSALNTHPSALKHELAHNQPYHQTASLFTGTYHEMEMAPSSPKHIGYLGCLEI